MLTTKWARLRECWGSIEKQLLGISTFALTVRREGLPELDIAFEAAAAFLPKRRCSITGALRDELLVTTFLGLLLTANLRAPLYLTLFATDASAAGKVRWGVSLEQWTKLFDLGEDCGESVRLDWEPGPPVETDTA